MNLGSVTNGTLQNALLYPTVDPFIRTLYLLFHTNLYGHPNI